ncbi:MAG: ParB/RepB/Spo0J family partition protein [bacterium]
MAGLSEKFSQHAKGLGTASTALAFAAPKAALTELLLTQIEPDPEQPRRDLGDLSELAASIREVGVIQPIIVTVVGYERYRILAGERRFSATRQAGLERIPALVRSVDEQRQLEIQLVENLHRKDLNPLEEALTYQRLLSEFRLTHEELGRRLGKTQVSVTETLKALDLPEQIQREILSPERIGREVSKSVLLEISRRPRSEQLRLWEEAKRGELTVRKIRASRAKSSKGKKKPLRDGAGFRYPITLKEQDAEVTINFAAPHARLESIVSALEEALAIERTRLQ